MSTELPAPPGHLSEPSKRLWRETVERYELAPHELRILRLALEAVDRCEQARRALRRHGLVMLDRWDKPVPRPEVKIEADSRAAAARLFAQLRLPDPEEEEPQPRTRHGRFGPKGGQGRRARDKSAPGAR
jgi:phage terminase small subunit